MSIRLSILVLAIAMLTTAAIAEETGKYSIKTATNETIGKFLVNETGFTLYYFVNDAPGNGTSTCYGECAKLWLPFYAKNIAVPSGLNATDFTVMTRTDGMKQTAYKGWPLYFFNKDKKPGDTFGQGVKSIWFVVNIAKFPPK